MTKRRVNKKIAPARRRVRRKNKVSGYLSRPELWIGIATIAVLTLLLTRLPVLSSVSRIKDYRIQIVKVTAAPSPVRGVNPAVKIKKEPAATPVPGSQAYIIEVNDSYYTITEKVCGDGRGYTYNQQLNGDTVLQVGETVTVRCDWPGSGL